MTDDNKTVSKEDVVKALNEIFMLDEENAPAWDRLSTEDLQKIQNALKNPDMISKQILSIDDHEDFFVKLLRLKSGVHDFPILRRMIRRMKAEDE